MPLTETDIAALEVAKKALGNQSKHEALYIMLGDVIAAEKQESVRHRMHVSLDELKKGVNRGEFDSSPKFSVALRKVADAWEPF